MQLAEVINEIRTFSQPRRDHDREYSLSEEIITRAIKIVNAVHEKIHILPQHVSPAEGVMLKYPQHIDVAVDADQFVILDADANDETVTTVDQTVKCVADLLK